MHRLGSYEFVAFAYLMFIRPYIHIIIALLLKVKNTVKKEFFQIKQIPECSL
jgi:hypothetical protein